MDPADAWYVGDNLDRDVVRGRRAGVGMTVLMTSKSTASRTGYGSAPSWTTPSP
ncbi:MAG TPA: HAD hydrolase-like protein [Nonomuraea sp.]|nr:HAD hydrolase-like protein [Nonomuraea sp.]